MKKEYQSPELDLVLFETNRQIMENELSQVDPDPFGDDDYGLSLIHI